MTTLMPARCSTSSYVASGLASTNFGSCLRGLVGKRAQTTYRDLSRRQVKCSTFSG